MTSVVHKRTALGTLDTILMEDNSAAQLKKQNDAVKDWKLAWPMQALILLPFVPSAKDLEGLESLDPSHPYAIMNIHAVLFTGSYWNLRHTAPVDHTDGSALIKAYTPKDGVIQYY
ncbi:hypothetical protein EDD85DRAFT_788041 [Armillaria nabsnona]|nr:hypothetical protein EDD85DRAFT_788041 [Armillaria nabsnona]